MPPVDAIINLVLGAMLVVFPTRLVTVLGIPPTDVTLHPSILGAVLFGIGIAILAKRFAVHRARA